MGKPVKGQVGSPVTHVLCLVWVGEDEMDPMRSMRDSDERQGGPGWGIMHLDGCIGSEASLVDRVLSGARCINEELDGLMFCPKLEFSGRPAVSGT